MPKSNNSDILHQSTSYQVKIISKIYLFCTFWASKILPIFLPVQRILPMVYRYTGGTVNFQNEQPYSSPIDCCKVYCSPGAGRWECARLRLNLLQAAFSRSKGGGKAYLAAASFGVVDVLGLKFNPPPPRPEKNKKKKTEDAEDTRCVS